MGYGIVLQYIIYESSGNIQSNITYKSLTKCPIPCQFLSISLYCGYVVNKPIHIYML